MGIKAIYEEGCWQNKNIVFEKTESGTASFFVTLLANKIIVIYWTNSYLLSVLLNLSVYSNSVIMLVYEAAVEKALKLDKPVVIQVMTDQTATVPAPLKH